MNFFKLIATATLAVSTVFAPAANAQLTYGEQQLFDALKQAGVSSTIGHCPDTDVLMGYFDPANNAIHICDNVSDTPEDQWLTFKHEAIHAAQHCVNPSMAFTITSSSFLLNNGLQDDWEHIVETYPRSDWAIELEAFTLMKLSDNEVASIVNSACN